MVMIKADAAYEAGNPVSHELTEAIGRHSAELMKAGTLLEVGGLLPSSHGARIQVSGGKTRITDGPFSEAKELIGGYAILKADSKDEAIRLARQFFQIHLEILGPTYEGEAEIRQMFDPSDYGPEGMCGGFEA
jgi:hypothetical protein